jgi:protein-tyrosine phosphatase
LIDLHSHILPGIDDGASDIDEALDIARQSVDIGVTHMMCTPHINQGVFDNSSTTITPAFLSLKEALDYQNIPLKIAFACEVRISVDILPLVLQTKLPYIGEWNGKPCLLLELPHSHVPPGVENLIKWLLNNNVQPIIPHPERNRDIMADYSKLLFLKRLGCLFQVTAGVFASRFSEKSSELAEQMLEEDLIHYVASDTHSVKRRPNDMNAARDKISQLTNEACAKRLTQDTPALITQNIHWV